MHSVVQTLLHDWPTWVIVIGLLALMLAANKLGFRIARWHHGRDSELSRTVSHALKGSIFALVALLLAFSFSATTNRHDLRQRLVLDQANAVGTCYLRAGLIPEPHAAKVRSILRDYVDTRLKLADVMENPQEAARVRTTIDRQMNLLWAEIQTAAAANPDAVHKSFLVPAANEVIDLSSTRAWANRNHLPDPVLALLLASVVISSLLVGHSSGQSKVRHWGLWFASNTVFALVLYIVLDFDRPQRGLIQIDQTPLIELQSTFKTQATN